MDERIYLDQKVQDLLLNISQTVGFAQDITKIARDRAANHQDNQLFDNNSSMFIESCRTDFSEVPQGKISSSQAELSFHNDTENSKLEIPGMRGNFYPDGIVYTVINFDNGNVTAIKIDASQDGLYIRNVVKSHINPENHYETKDLKIYTDKISLLEAKALLNKESPNLRIHYKTAMKLEDKSDFSATVENHHNTIAYAYDAGYYSGMFTGVSVGFFAGFLLALLVYKGLNMYRFH